MAGKYEADWLTWEAKQLAKRRCPHSGDRLVLDNLQGGAPPGRLSCAICDCFGFDPADPRIGKL